VTFAELLHAIVEYGSFGGNIDQEEAYKAIDAEFPVTKTGPEPAVGIDAGNSTPAVVETV
jgi:hypothetical protein